MKFAALLCVFVLGVVGCQSDARRVTADAFKQNNFVGFVPPQGNPASTNSWNKRGPGVVMRNQAYAVEYEALHVLGPEALAKIVADANSPTERVPFKALSNARTTGSSLDGSGGWRFAAAAADISAKLNLTNATSVDVKFGDTWVAELSESELRKAPGVKDIAAATRRNLEQGKSFMVLKTIYSDSFKIYFKRQKTNGLEVALKIPVVDEQKLGGSYRVDSDGGVEINEPVIVGYVPLPPDGVRQLFEGR